MKPVQYHQQHWCSTLFCRCRASTVFHLQSFHQTCMPLHFQSSCYITAIYLQKVVTGLSLISVGFPRNDSCSSPGQSWFWPLELSHGCHFCRTYSIKKGLFKPKAIMTLTYTHACTNIYINAYTVFISHVLSRKRVALFTVFSALGY